MNRTSIFLKSNLKKTKSQLVSVFFLILISALLLNLFFLVAFRYDNQFDRNIKKQNDGNVTFVLAGTGNDLDGLCENALSASKDVKNYEKNAVSILQGTVQYGKYRSKTLFYGMSKTAADEKEISKVEFFQDSGKEGVYLPYQFYASGNYKLGDEFFIELNGEKKVDTTVCGFYQTMMSSSVEARICGFIFTDSVYADVAADNAFPLPIVKAYLLNIQTEKNVDPTRFQCDFASKIGSTYPLVQILGQNNVQSVKNVRYTNQIIVGAVVGVAALVLTAVSLIIVASNILFFIRQNMKSFGMLKAIGYQSGTLRKVILFEFLLITLFGATAGIALTYAIFPLLNRLMEAMTGVKFPLRFDVPSAVFALGTLLLLVFLTALLSSRNLKTLPPIAALRAQKSDRLSQRNVLPLEKSPFRVDVSLALKTAIRNMKQNIVVLITVFGLCLATVFSVLMSQNIICNKVPMIEMTNHNADVLVNVPYAEKDGLTTFLDQDERIETFFLYKEVGKVLTEKNDVITTMVCDPEHEIINGSYLYKGRYPKTDGEIALGALYASEHGKKIGDTIRLSVGETTVSYRITGLVQIAGFNGADSLLTVDGYLRLSAIDTLDYLLILQKGHTLGEVQTDILSACPTAQVEDYKLFMEGCISSFVNLMQYIIIGLIVLCVFLIVFVFYILTKMLIAKKQNEISVLKSLGYKTNRIILQTALSFMPVAVIGLAVGMIISCLSINTIFSLFIRSVGIVKTVFTFSYAIVAGCGVLILLIAFLDVCLFCGKIRKSSPKELFTEV